jgi:hypothetical protein
MTTPPVGQDPQRQHRAEILVQPDRLLREGPARRSLSYNYKAKNIIETTNNGSDLQRWHAGAGFLDGNITYKINDSIEVRLDALNLTNALTYDYFDDVSGRYGDGRESRAWTTPSTTVARSSSACAASSRIWAGRHRPSRLP